MTRKRLLITGSGCLGSALARRVSTQDMEVTVVDLSVASLALLDSGVATICADITDPDAMKAAITGMDIVIHTAASLDGLPEVQEHVNVVGTATVAEAAAEAGVERLVHVSSNAVYGIGHTTDITEDMGPSPSGQVYSMTKAQAEAEVWRVAAASGLAVTIVRPAGIFGPGAEYFSASFYKRGKRKPVVFLGKGGGAMYCSFVDDVADLLILAATHSAAVGEVFNCVIDPPPTQRQYMAAWSQLSGHDRYLGIPMFLGKFAGFVVRPFARKGSYLSELNANLTYVDRYVRIDASKAKSLLGWSPRHTLESGVEATIPWLRESGLMDDSADAANPSGP